MAFGNATKGYVKSHSGGGGSGGTSNYNDLSNKPKINGVELTGNKTSEDLNIGGGSFSFTEVTKVSNDFTIDNVNNITGIYIEFRFYNSVAILTQPVVIFKPTLLNVDGNINLKYDSDSLNFTTTKNGNSITLRYAGSTDYTPHIYTF